ncbi:hybrid sensor histidine kinase/response regulator transcription factor [Pedobacter mucosus]|uniref:hybrid sensor histidine kinase/response regulator transcription factor n=1 Tax=Pedobacter mucosus TaxID=2895286 RepID=UPI001EE4B0F8|nr:two-component regulator propeller domain-containing protein [Pedobacter mucosus]UKT65201.1 response regulator [Pedobacter mucosus]
MLKFIFSLLFFSSFFIAKAQLNANITHYSTADGLSHAGVLCMLKDRDGFMWFGTTDGINRFDGHNFVVYKSRPGDTSKLKSNKIRNIIEDKQGYLWVETYDSEIYKFDKKTEQFTPISEGKFKHLFQEQMVIGKIIADDINGVWLLSEEHGIFKVTNTSSQEPLVYHYSKNESPNFKLKGNVVNVFQIDNSGDIWLGTNSGLNCLRKNKSGIYQVVQFNKSVDNLLSSAGFTCATIHDKQLYLGTDNGRLLIYNIQRKTFTADNTSSRSRLNALCYTKTGNLYISTATNGLLSYNLKTLKVVKLDANSTANYLSLYEDDLGQIWIEPEKSGVIKYNPKTKTFKPFLQKKDYASSSRSYEVFTDVNGVLWARMKDGGFGYYDQKTDQIQYFYNEPGAENQKFSNIISSLFSDKTGVLWVCARDGGINKIVFLRNKFNYRKLIERPQIRAENEVRAIMHDSKDRLWICTKDGQIYIYDHGQRVSLLPSSIEQIGLVYSILEDTKGNIWLGTKGNGLLRATPIDGDKKAYSLKQFKNNINDINSLSSDLVYSVIEDKKGRIWVGTLGGGINLFTAFANGEGFKNYANAFKKYPFSWAKIIRHLCEDGHGRIWVATSNGLIIFDPNNKIEDYNFLAYRKIRGDKTSLGSNSVQHVYKDLNENMWVGTFGGGINKATVSKSDNKQITFEPFTIENGLSNDVVLSITGDKQNNLWIATEDGLSRLNTKQRTFKNYDAFDGLSKGGFSEAAAFTAQNGKVYFGCIDGFIAFDPLAIGDHKGTANMALTRIQLYYKDIVPGGEDSPLMESINEAKSLVLNYNQNVISLDYTVLDFRATGKITYAYKLEGFDKSWHLVNDQRKATYTNLPPGEYTFRVRATSEDLFSKIPEKNLNITVKPPFYHTSIAYIIYFLLASCLIFFARRIIITMIKLRNKVLVEQKLTEVKLSFFTNISHELRTPLTLIVNPLDEILKHEALTNKGKEYLSIINRNTERMTRFINQLLDFRKMQNGKTQLSVKYIDLFALAKFIGQHFYAVAEEKNITLLVQSNCEEVYGWVDEEKIDIIIYNLLSNAFKFTPIGKEIYLNVNLINASEDIEIKIIDSGLGVPEEKLEEIFEIYYEGIPQGDEHLKGTGIGLALARGLAINHNGKLWAQNNENEGMTFTLFLRGGKDHYNQSMVNFPSINQRVDQEVSDQHVASNFDVNQQIITEKSEINRNWHLLLVEDNIDLRRFLEIKLSGLYRVTSANNGAEGLKLAKSIIPDLIISDVMMPLMNGIEMLDKLRHNDITSHIPVIMLTAKSSIESQIEGLKYGADIYLTKPFHTDFLLAAIDNLITSRKKLFEYLSTQQEKRVLNLEPGEIIITSKDEEFLKQVIQIVEDRMKDPEFNIDDVATAINMGRSTFYKKLKSLSSLSPVELVRDMRLKRSRQLLDSGSYSVSEAGYLSGFNSSPYFSTCFKEKYKISPSAYLKESNSKR